VLCYVNVTETPKVRHVAEFAIFYIGKAKGDFWFLGGGMAPFIPLKSAYGVTSLTFGVHVTSSVA